MFKPLAATKCVKMLSNKSKLQRIHFVTYADDSHGIRGGLFARRQQIVNNDVRIRGVAQIVAYNSADLKNCSEFCSQPDYFLKHPHYNGYAFKPVLIRKALKTIEDGEYIIYYDCSDFLIGKHLVLLTRLCDMNGGVLVWQYGDANARWVKSVVFDACGDQHRKHLHKPHLAATWFIFRVTSEFRSFVEQWANLNVRPELAAYHDDITPSDVGGKQKEHAEFIQNRGDQSIFSVLCAGKNYKGFYGAGYGLNRSPKMFALSMWTGSHLFQLMHKLRK